MTLAEDTYAKLQATPAITAIFSTRTYPMRLPESCSYPALAFQVITTLPEHTHDGLVNPLERMVQMTVYDTDYKRCAAAGEAIIAALVGRSTWNTRSTTCRLAGGGEDMDPEPRGLYRYRVDLFVRVTA